jgi:hypothetical protein
MNRHASPFVLTMAMTAVAIPMSAVSSLASTAADFEVSVRPDQRSYVPGEAVTLTIGVTNRTSTRIVFPGLPPSVERGDLKVFIADGDSPTSFRRYNGPGWGVSEKRGRGFGLAPGETSEASARVLYQPLSDITRIPPEFRETAFKGALMRIYAFPAAGTYAVKVVFCPRFDCKKAVESPQVTIEIAAPEGPDLDAWNELRNSQVYAAFLHDGGVPPVISNAADRARQLGQLKDFADRHATSRYSARIRALLSHDGPDH